MTSPTVEDVMCNLCHQGIIESQESKHLLVTWVGTSARPSASYSKVRQPAPESMLSPCFFLWGSVEPRGLEA